MVDDEPSILTSTALLLESLGHEVAALRDHAASLRVLESFHADVVLQDVRMPGLNLEAHLRRLRDAFAGRAPRVVLFSASMDIAETAAGLPADGWLEKPFRPQELASALERAVAAGLRDARPTLAPSA